MSKIGGKVSIFLIAVAVLSLIGMAGTALYYQEQIEEKNEAVQERENRIEELETELNETEEELREVRLEVKELRGIEQEVIGLEARNEDLRSLLTGQIEGAEEAERRRREAVKKLEKSQEEVSELEDRLDSMATEYDRLLADYEDVYEKCEAAEGCSVSPDGTSPDNYSSSDSF